MKILVVDDERAVRDSLRRALELEGYEVELADDGVEALGRLESDPDPDAMILDVLMPPPDGLEVCRTLRRTGSRLPVLMLTARAEVENRVEGLDAGRRRLPDEAVRPRGAARAPARAPAAHVGRVGRDRSASPTSSSTRGRARCVGAGSRSS